MNKWSAFLLVFWIICCIISCSTQSEKRPIPTFNELHIDSILSSFPVQVGNDKGQIVIKAIRTFENDTLVRSSFLVTLDSIEDYSISKFITIDVLRESGMKEDEQDSTKSVYQSTVISEMIFEGIRSNTLTFKTLISNTKTGENISGRFNLFYRTQKKGLVYGLKP